jgi:hypothetical protein
MNWNQLDFLYLMTLLEGTQIASSRADEAERDEIQMSGRETEFGTTTSFETAPIQQKASDKCVTSPGHADCNRSSLFRGFSPQRRAGQLQLPLPAFTLSLFDLPPQFLINCFQICRKRPNRAFSVDMGNDGGERHGSLLILWQGSVCMREVRP